ncbi:MAG: histidine phosphatase family protein [Anaerolineae bacterium]
MARHGQSLWQVEGDSAGSNAPLTELGELQAHRLGEYLTTHYEPAALYTSHLQHAQRTAEIVADYVHLPVMIDEELREFDEWEAGWAPEPVSRWDPSPIDAQLSPGYLRFRSRIEAALRRIVDRHAEEESVMIVAHGGSIGAMWRILVGSDTPRLWTWNAALHQVEWEKPNWGRGWVFQYINLMEYLPVHMRTS